MRRPRRVGPPGPPAAAPTRPRASRRGGRLPGVLVVALAAAGVALGAGTSAAQDRRPQTRPAFEMAPSVQASRGARGTVRLCGDLPPSVIEGFNRRHRARGLRLRTVSLPEGVDHREALLDLQRARSRRCDLFLLDVIWTAEFAETRSLLDVSRIVRPRRDEFLPATLTTARWRGRWFGVPQTTDAGLLYYRSDRIAAVPDTWQGVYESARANGGIVYQGDAYEGLTCDFLELAFAAGGSVLSANGRSSVIDSPENLRALQLMVDGVRTGAAPSIVTAFNEYATHSAFFAGGPAYMRNWPYAYSIGQGSSLAGSFGVVPLPAFAEGGRAGVLGGWNAAISRYARNRRGAVLAVDWLTSATVQEIGAREFGASPVLRTSYDDPDVQEALPFAAQLRQAVESARSRPAHPRYPELSAAIYTNVNAALRGDASPEQALRRADREIEAVLRRR